MGIRMRWAASLKAAARHVDRLSEKRSGWLRAGRSLADRVTARFWSQTPTTVFPHRYMATEDTQ